jgi:hypothetical protein
MPSGSKLVAVLTIAAGVAAGVMFAIALLKARPKAAGDVSAIPPTPATSSSVQSPAYDVLTGVGGLTPLQDHPDVTGTSIAPTNPH